MRAVIGAVALGLALLLAGPGRSDTPPSARGGAGRSPHLAATAPRTCPALASGGPDYSGQTLVNTNFAYRDLAHANFKGATLDGVIFIGAKLNGASFEAATFTNERNGAAAPALPTDFTDADLSDACFASANFQAASAPVYLGNARLTCTDFSGTDLSRLNVIFDDTPAFAQRAAVGTAPGCRVAMRGTALPCDFIDQWKTLDLTDAMLTACAMATTSTLLQKRDFSDALMEGVDFYEINLQGAVFDNAQLHGADFSYANLKDASFKGAQLGVAPGSSLKRPANMKGAYMPGVDLSNADLRSVDLTQAHIYGKAKFVKTQLDSADLSLALLPEAQFSGSLTNASFNGALLVNAIFNGASLSNAKFDSAYLQGVDYSSAVNVRGLSLNNAAVSTASGVWSYTDQDGQPTSYAYGATNLGLLATDAGSYCPSNQPSPCQGRNLLPSGSGPYPPAPACIPRPPKYCNCLPGGCAAHP